MNEDYVLLDIEDDFIISCKEDAQRYLGGNLSTKTSRKRVNCYICLSKGLDRQHQLMEYIFKCTKAHEDNRDCRTLIKLTHCSLTEESNLYVLDDGDNCLDEYYDIPQPQHHGISNDMKDLIRPYIQNGVGSKTILKLLKDRVPAVEGLPSENQIKAFLQGTRDNQGADLVATLTDAIRDINLNSDRFDRAFLANYDENHAFVFGFETVANEPILGQGSDTNNFLLIVSTKASFGKYVRVQNQTGLPGQIMLHIDGTHNTTTFGYQLVTIGVTDLKHQLHVLGIRILTQHSL